MRTRRTDEPIRGASEGLSAWFETPLGQVVLEKEAGYLLAGARRFHGESMLWLGPVGLPQIDLNRCMVRDRIFGAVTGRSALSATPDCSAYLGCLEALPFKTASMDAVVLHHGLECASDSRLAMGEVARVLRPGGRLLICGFNPFSLWGLRPIWGRFRRDAFSGAQFVSPLRLMDWLAVLGLEIDDPVRYLVFRPPLGSGGSNYARLEKVRDALDRWQIPFGGVYGVLARKKAAAGVGPEVRLFGVAQRPRIVPTALPKPTARHIA